jgi:hypothetical protein
MRIIKTILSALFLLSASISTAQAVTCVNGVYRAGCAGPNGAAVVNKNVPPPRGAVVVAPPRGGAVVVKPAPQCAWVNGRKVCR